MQACEKEHFYKTMESPVKSSVGHAPVSIGIERLELKERKKTPKSDSFDPTVLATTYCMTA